MFSHSNMRLWPVNKLPRMRKVYLFTAFSCSTFQKKSQNTQLWKSAWWGHKGHRDLTCPFSTNRNLVLVPVQSQFNFTNRRRTSLFFHSESWLKGHIIGSLCASVYVSAFHYPVTGGLGVSTTAAPAFVITHLATKHEFWSGTPFVCIFVWFKNSIVNSREAVYLYVTEPTNRVCAQPY